MRDRGIIRMGCLLVVLGGATAAAQPPPTPTDDEVFERVFKHRPGGKHQRVSVPLLVDGEDQGLILVELLPGGNQILLPAEPIVAALVGKLRIEARQRVDAAVADHRLSADALRSVGLDVTFDPRRLELQVGLPPELRETAIHEQGNRVPAEAARALRPSDTSGFLNARGGGGVIWSTADLPSDRPPLHLNLESAVNVRGFVLEGRADFAEGPVGAHRGDVLLSRDDPRRAVRLLAGDFAVPGTTFQPSFPILGVGVLRSFALQPYRLIQPAGQFDFLLERPSQVTVYVNGAPVQTLTLPAGPHDVRDLPLGAGVNNLELVIRDDRGIERRLSFATATAGSLLVPGLSQFAYSLGFPLIDDIGARTYDWSQPTLSLQHRLGISPTLTLGGKLDASFDRQTAANQIVWATALGNFGLDLALSHDGDAGLGYAASLRYDYLVTKDGTALQTAFTAIAQHLSNEYRSLGFRPIVYIYSDDFSVLVSHRLGKLTIAGATLRYQVRQEAADAQEAALTLSHSIGSSVAIDVSASARRSGPATADIRVQVGVRWILPERRGSLHILSRASSREGPSNQASWGYSDGAPADGIAASATVGQTANDANAAGSLEYTGYRFTSGVATSATVVNGQATQTTGVELGTALVFADGKLAWSRPVTGSFALIARNDALAGTRVGVNPSFGAYTSKADWLGEAVVPNLQPYTVNPVFVDAPDLPVGVLLGPSLYWLLPTYKSGTLIRVGEEGTVFVRGVLLNADGSPAAMASGEVVAAGDAKRVPIVLLTNRVGRFGLSGLKPGRYEIRLTGSTAPPIPFEIPRGFAGVFTTGELRLAPTAD